MFRWGQDFPTEFPSFIVSCCGVDQISSYGERKSYYYKDMESVLELKEDLDVFAFRMKHTNRLVSVAQVLQLMMPI